MKTPESVTETNARLIATLNRIAASCEEFTTDRNCDADPYDLMEAFLGDIRETLGS